MPNVGDTINGKLLGKPGSKFIWTVCPDCKAERWSQSRPHDPGSIRRCLSCHRSFTREQFKLRGSR
jgi:transposase-like protein